MKRFLTAMLAAGALVAASAPALRADGEGGDDLQLTRDEASAYKKKLAALVGALGAPPAEYEKTEERFSLPYGYSKAGDKGKYQPISGSVRQTYGGKGGAAAKQNAKSGADDLRKKMMEAQARGDMAQMMQLSQQAQQQMGQAGLAAAQAQKPPVEVNAVLNQQTGSGGAFDPDAVLFDKPGVIAIKSSASDKETVDIYFDPVSFKDPKKVSRVELRQPDGGIAGKLGVVFASVQITGPSDVVEPWAKKIDTAKVLGLIGQ